MEIALKTSNFPLRSSKGIVMTIKMVSVSNTVTHVKCL